MMMKNYYFAATFLMVALGGVSLNIQATSRLSTGTVNAINPFSGSMAVSNTPHAKELILQENQLLSQEIKAWVAGNGYKLFWNSKKDYLIYNTISITGKTEDDILQSLGEIFASENYGLIVKKYEKNRVIVIDEM